VGVAGGSIKMSEQRKLRNVVCWATW